MAQLLRRRLSPAAQDFALAVATGRATPEVSAQVAFEACCRLRQAVIDLGTNEPGVRCEALRALEQARCTPPPSGEFSVRQYVASVRATLEVIIPLLLQRVLDCACEGLIPPCPPAPCDNRLILACLRVKNGRILDICNFSCRRFAGGFPSLFYWLSAYPLAAIIRYQVGRWCCGGDEEKARLEDPANPLAAMLRSIDPAAALRQALLDGAFALPTQFAAAVESGFGAFDLEKLAAWIPSGALNVATLVDQPVEVARRVSQEAGVTAILRDLQGAAEPTIGRVTASPFATRGDSLALYVRDGKVAIAVPMGQAEAAREEIRSLRAEVEELRKTLTSRRNPGG